jgi:hypothetical protein
MEVLHKRCVGLDGAQRKRHRLYPDRLWRGGREDRV